MAALRADSQRIDFFRQARFLAGGCIFMNNPFARNAINNRNRFLQCRLGKLFVLFI